LGSILLILRKSVHVKSRHHRDYIPLDTDNKDEPGLGGHEERVVALRGPLSLDHIALSLEVLLVVLRGLLTEDSALRF
jgi:hypothetical protein